MFGIGLPELIVILALALIVVGPEKLPELARSLAKGMMELKKTANSLRDSIQEEMEEAGKELKPWEKLPPGTLGEDAKPEADAGLEEQQEKVVLPEEQDRKHAGDDDGEKAAS